MLAMNTWCLTPQSCPLTPHTQPTLNPSKSSLKEKREVSSLLFTRFLSFSNWNWKVKHHRSEANDAKWEREQRGWRDGSAIKNTCCSCRGPYQIQFLAHRGSYPSIIPVPDPTLPLVSMAQTHIQEGPGILLTWHMIVANGGYRWYCFFIKDVVLSQDHVSCQIGVLEFHCYEKTLWPHQGLFFGGVVVREGLSV